MSVESTTSDFAQLVARFRQQHGMSQGQLAHATRLSRTYIYHIENGMRKNPSRLVPGAGSPAVSNRSPFA